MRRIVTILFALTSFSAFADTWTDPNTGIEWRYTIDNGEASLGAEVPAGAMTWTLESMTAVSIETTGAITIPSTLGGCPVTRIGEYAFYCCGGLKSITIPSSVTSIEDNAFICCWGLTSFCVDDNNFSFSSRNGLLCSKDGAKLFAGVNGEVVIPNCVEDIGVYAFCGYSRLVSITIPSSVTNISVVSYSGTMSMGWAAFFGCDMLENLEFLGLPPDGINQSAIMRYAANVRYPQEYDGEWKEFVGSDRFGGYIFEDSNTGIIWTYTIADGTAIVGGASTFPAVHRATTGAIIIPSMFGGCLVTSIGRRAFYGCGGLTSVTIPSGVTSIGNDAFFGCSGLTSVAMPSSVTRIGECAFYCCGGLKSITIPSSVGSIGYGAFYGCSGLMTMSIPSSVASIGEEAFSWCSGLASFCVDENNSFFSSINGLLCSKDGKNLVSGVNGDVIIPDCVESIEYGAFYGRDAITSVTIPACVTSFLEIFPDAYAGIKEVIICDGVTSIGSDEFAGCSGLAMITIPSSVASIGERAFDGCRSLTSITIPSSVMSIGPSAFSGCSGLVELTISSSKTSVITSSYYMPTFFGCSGLTKVTIPAWKLSSVFPQAYTTIKEVIICDGVTSITESMFAGCSELTSVTLPSSVVNIGDDAFNSCDKLTSITIPQRVTKVGSRAFSDCANLLSVEFKGDAPDYGDDVFDGTPRRLVVSVPSGSIGWDGGFTANLPEGWCGRAIVHSGESYDWDAGIAGVYLTTTNVVVQYVVNGVMPEDVTPPIDTDFVAVLTEIKGGAVSVPQSWPEQFPGFTAKFGSDFGKALTMATGKTGIGGAPMLVWQDYVAGTDPTNPDDKFAASITFDENNKPIISWSPELKDERGNYLRKYTVYGKSKLNDVTWTEVKDDAENYNFFKVTVEMP